MSDEERKGRDPDDGDDIEFLNREDDNDDIDDAPEETDEYDAFPLAENDEDDEMEDEDLPEDLITTPIAAASPPDPDDEDVDEPVAAATAPPAPEPDTTAGDEESPPVTATRRSGGGGGGGGMSRIMIGAGALIVIGALFIFWPRGGGMDEDGDLMSVVTLPDSNAAAVTASPRSSDVDLDQELQQVVPETPEHGEATPEGTRASLRQEADVRSGTATDLAEPDSPTTGGTVPAEVRQQGSIVPGDPTTQGKWAVQMGAFGTRDNAARAADDLSGKGFRSEVVSKPSTNGGTSYKVWIGYFETRAEATAYALKHRDALGTDTFITHR